MSSPKHQDHEKTAEWLAAFADQQDNAAFSELVRVYSGMVHASALRRTSDAHLAEDVTQDVFALLARKAGGLKDHPSITGWLFTTTRLVARDALRSEQRRRKKLQMLQKAKTEEGSESENPTLPALDEALDKLNGTERDVLLWHYFERMPYQEIASRLGKSEEACRKQSSRALRKIADQLRSQGYAVSAAAVVAALSTQLLQVAPSALASSLAKSSIVGAASLSKTSLLLNSIQTMAYTKTKTAIAVAAIAAVPISLQWKQNQNLERMLAEKAEGSADVESQVQYGGGGQTRRSANGTTVTPEEGSLAVLTNNNSERPATLGQPVAVQGKEESGNAADYLNDRTQRRSFADLNQRVTKMSSTEISQLIATLRDEPGHPQQTMLENILTFQLMGKDPEAMLNLKMQYPDLPVLGRTYRTWGQIDPDAALAHLESQKNSDWNNVGLASILQGIGDVDPDRALDVLVETDEAVNFHYLNLFRSWTRNSAPEAATAIGNVPEPFLETALTTIADNWPEIDPQAASDWVDGLDPSKAAIARPVLEKRIAQLADQNAEGDAPVNRLKVAN